MSRTTAFAAVIMLLVAGLAASGVVGGLATVGNQPLVGLDGHLLASGQAAGAVLLAWASVLAPTLAFAAVGLLGSVALGRPREVNGFSGSTRRRVTHQIPFGSSTAPSIC